MSRMTSHYSVQVLATLIFLSYSKLIDTVVGALRFSEVEVENNTIMYMWYEDGNVRYFKDLDHCILGVLAILVLICAVLPYTILLTVLPFMYRFKWVNRIRPFLDAHYGPYKDKYQWWFGLRLWIVFLSSVLSGVMIEQNVEYLVTSIDIAFLVFTLGQAYVKPFKSNYINLLEILVMIDFNVGLSVLLSSCSNEFPMIFDYSIHIWFFEAQVIFLFILFWIIVAGHIYKACRCKRSFTIKMKSFGDMISNNGNIIRSRSESVDDDGSNEPLLGYREPLLSDTD